MRFHFLLLRRITNQDGTGRKARLAGGVLRMKMCRREKEFRIVRCKSGDHTRDSGPVLRTQARINNKRCTTSHHDSYIGEPHDRPDMVGNFRGGLGNHRLAHLCKCVVSGESCENQNGPT